MELEHIEPLNVFVSYRRTDRPGHAGRVGDALRRSFGNDHVFYDVTTIRGGVDFAVALKRAIEKSAVVAVIIGPDWGRPRLWDRLLSRPDWVRFEIEYARQAGKPILPIVVGGASMPRTLPPGLRFLSTIQAASLRDESWDTDVEDLLEHLTVFAKTHVSVEPVATGVPVSILKRPMMIASAVVLAVSAAWLAPRLWTDSSRTSTEGGTLGAVSTPNRPPTAGSIGVDQPGQDTLLSGNRVGLASATRFALTARQITDPDGDVLRYTWDFGDGSPPPPSAPKVEKVYERVSRFQVKLFVNDGKLPNDMLAAETDITTRDVSGTWALNLVPDPGAPHPLPTRFAVTLVQQGNLLSGRILPAGSDRSTVLSGNVEHPARVYFGSESAWWNDNEDAYFDLQISDGYLAIQMTNRTPNRCGPQIPCLSLLANRQ